MDRASHLSDSYKKRDQMLASRAQPKTCWACEKKGHIAATCSVPKDKLYCKHCDMKSSHNTSACFKNENRTKRRKRDQKRINQEQKNLHNPQKEQKRPKKDDKEICLNHSDHQLFNITVVFNYNWKEIMDVGDIRPNVFNIFDLKYLKFYFNCN